MFDSIEPEWLWLIVRRTINGVTQRYIERMVNSWSPFHPSADDDGRGYGYTVDCGKVFDNAGGASSFS